MKLKFYGYAILFNTLLFSFQVKAQDNSGIDNDVQSALENITEQQDQSPENDAMMQQLAAYKLHPLNLNKATANDLAVIPFLTPLQIDNFLTYRKLLGPLISIYELQAVPGWDVATIQKILPFVKVNSVAEDYHFNDYIKKGRQTLLARYSRVIEPSEGYIRKTGSRYLGSPDKFLLRYQYYYSRHIYAGITAEKDAGEQFFRGAQSAGFDFYSVHFFLKNYHHIKALALGDFTVNMGQGLINWQGLAFSKTGLVLNIKKESDLLRPYSSPGEILFYRGAGITLQKNNWEVTGFISYKPLDANIDVSATDSSEKIITSLVTSGYHRTAAEIDNKHTAQLFTAGGNIAYQGRQWKAGFNFIHHYLNTPIHKRDALYNLYAFSGKQLTDMSVNYSGTAQNIHFFGETALSDNRKIATVNGALANVSTHSSLGILYRYYDKAYHALYPSGFGEGYNTNNESGVYAAINMAFPKWQLSAYLDIFHFPWLRYQVDAPSAGWDHLVELNCQLSPKLIFFSQYNIKQKQTNGNNNTPVHQLANTMKQHWRNNIIYAVNRNLSLSSRVELSGYQQQGSPTEYGWLTYLEATYKTSSWKMNVRLVAFHINGYDARIYTYENDVLYGYDIPFFYHQGYRYYINAHYRFSKHLDAWLKWAQTIYPGASTIGSGLDTIQGHIKSLINAEIVYRL